ncbi:MAG TPA: hypothetical protein VMD30_08415 [Tepidisphaeraceae bacterium]|nr:hypothetical protein [Tepidisphaeraceae bacterium]
MSLYYNQTLIPVSKTFLPKAAQVGRFFASLTQLGVLPPDAEIALRFHTGKTRTLTNRSTGATLTIPMPDHTKLQGVDQIEESVAPLGDYEIEVHGTCRPKTAPLPINFDGPYHAGVTCIVSQLLRSTSDLHEESGTRTAAIPYKRPCSAEQTIGLFSNPHNLEVITVAEAGCAKCWLEFGVGKNLFPAIEGGNLAILDPKIVDTAETEFGVRFVQGCYWG